MSVYQPLADFLSQREDDRWEASFVDVMKVLNRSLPGSAYKHQAWWANQEGEGRSQTQGWRSVGWKTTRLDLERRSEFDSRFRRIDDSIGPDLGYRRDGVLTRQRDLLVRGAEGECCAVDDRFDAAIRCHLLAFFRFASAAHVP